MEKVGEYEKMEEKKNKKIITECLNNVKRNSLKKEKESKINISLKIVIPIVIAILLVTFIVSFILLNYNKQSDNYQLSGSQEYQTTTYSDEYKKTSDLTDADLNDAYQKNYQKSTADDGSYLIKSAEWTDKQKGEGLITIQGAQYQELEETSALYVATMCYAHGLTEDILVRNIQTLIKYYDKVDFIAINNCYAEGILDSKTFTKDATEDEIRLYVSEAKNSGMTYPHLSYSIPYAIQEYLFGNAGDEYINASNLINNPTAIYTSFDSFYLGNTGGTTASSGWGAEYGTEKYFNFIKENFANRYFSMSQYSRQEGKQCIGVRYPFQKYEASRLNVLIGILNPENYGEADLVYSEESLNKWQADNSEDLLELPVEDKKYLADYSYSQDFEATGVQVITNCTIADTVQDYFEIVDVNATGGSASMQTKVMGQNVLVYDENYVCGNEVKITIKVKLRQDETFYFDGFQDTNFGKATLSGKANISVDSPKLATIYRDGYKPTIDLTEEDKDDEYQKNYQETITDDGSYLRKTAEWTNKEKGEAVIKIKGVQNQALEETSALYVATMCYQHELTEDILVKNIQTLAKCYDKVDFIAINNSYEAGIAETQTFTSESTEEEIRNYIANIKSAGLSNPHAINSVPAAIQKYLFGNMGDEYISEDNLINDPTALYISTDVIYFTKKLDTNTLDPMWGIEYATQKYFDFIEERYGDRYFTMSQTSKQDEEPSLLIRGTNVYDTNILNIVLGILSPENYGKAEMALSEDSINQLKENTLYNLYLPFTDNEYAADYNYSQDFDEAGVEIITNCTITDTVQDYFEIVDVEASGASESMYIKVNGQDVLFYDQNYVCGNEVTIKIKVKLRDDVISHFDGFIDTNLGKATLSGKANISVDSPKLAPIITTYTVNYLEKETNKVLNNAKTDNNIPINTQIKATDEVIDIDGYNYDSADKEILTLGTGENVINLYYTKRTDLSYKVNYLEKDTNKVLSAQKVVNNQTFGTVINSEDEIIIINGYNYDSADKTSLTIGTGTNVINLYYTKKDASVLVHHYIDGTETKVPAKNGGEVADETITGKVDDKYSTNASSNIANNYELVTSKLPANASGTMTEEQIVVTYYYQLKDPTLTSNISKTSTLNKVTSKDQEIPYTITFTANVDTYIGDAEVIIVDTLPYTIDESKSDLAGGTYNAEAKTITWKENITGIDSFASIKNQINITKEIKVVYKDLDVTQANVTNKVTGTINLKTPEKTDTTEVTKDIPTEYLKDVKVTKIWNDNNNSASKRPANVTVVLTGDGKTYKQQLSVQNVVSGNNNNWEYTFTNLPKYNAQGVEIDYVLSEEVSSEANNKFYSANIDQGNKTITNTFTVPDEKVTVTAKKVWNDNNNSAQKRPNSVTLTVTGTGAGVNVSKEQEITSANAVAGDSNAWEYTFTELPKYDENGDEVEYTINEKDLNNEFYIKSNVDQATRTVTNTFQVPGENIDIPVTKIWDDNNNEAGKRPTSVTLQVKNGNEVVAEEEVTEADGWKHTFSVPKYNADGNEINYTIDEKDLGNKFYTKENAVIDQDARTITNKFEVPDEKVSIKVTKVWDDNNNSAGKRPRKVTMVLTGASQAHKQDLTVENADSSNNNNWIYTFNDLPKYDSKGNEINYILSEELDSIYYTSANSKIDQNTKTITNTFKIPTDKISIPVVKVWNDNNNTANKRPDNVVLVLTGNDGSEAHKVTLSGHNADANDGNRWLYTFTDLPKYNSTNGDEIVYTLSEEKLNSKFYTTSVDQESKTVTNTFSVPDEKTSVTVRKVWNDNNNTAQKRPESVTLILSASGSEVARQTLTSSNAIESATNTWEYTFNDLKKYDANGNEIEYTLSEENLNNKFYTSDVNQENKTVTNTFSVPDEKVSVTVTKTWNDNNNEAGKRPTSITLKVSGNGKNYTQEVTEANADSSNSNNWVYTFNDLPKYDGNGDEIAYTVDELDLNNEFYIKSSVNQETRTIVNTFQVPGENVTIPVTKIWDDNDDKAQKRPESVTVQVKNGEEVVAESPVTADTEWKHEFTLPKFDDYGNEIKYTIDEADLNNKYYEKGNVDQTAKTITNVSKYGKVTVHYYIEGTQTRVPDINGSEVADVVIEGKQGESYNTNAAENVKQNYELVETPSNATGTISVDDTEVIYYYRLKTPNITNQVINKTGTDRITVANQEMNYTVTYTAEIADYIGDAEVTIVDTLPYAIDEGKSDLAGGTYDSTGKTITWTENISDINSFTGNGTVNITKNFKVVYVGLDMKQEKITNNVKGNIKLLTPEKTSEEVTGSQESTIYKAIISSEKLADKTEAIEGEKVKYTIRITNDGNLAKTVTVRDTLPAGITFDKDTLIQVGETGTVYTEQNLKNGIPVEVPANGSIDVVFAGKVDTLANNEYSKILTNQATVDNEPTNEVTTNVTKANITAHKEAEPSSGNKVREGDEIAYRIRVRNDGTRAGDVIVKDTIPTGTTFVEGSIKIDNVADSSKTATDLQNGISITVGVGKEVVVEFKVRVNKLIDGTKIKNTAYINQNGEDKKVPEEPEHTYVEPKEEQSISKNGTTTIESLNEEITYNINYTAKITDYEGRATVKLVDTLPYAIDEGRSDLAGGTYDEASKTITWEEAVENIQLTEEKEVTINKTIKVVYKDVSQDTVSIKNVVTGHIEYETPVMTSDKVTANSTTTTGFTVNIPVSKVWEDDSDKLGQRPTKVVFKLHGSDGSEYTKEMSKPGTAGSTTTQDSANPNKWNDIFENLPKYDSNNQEIVYTITEEEKTEGDLKYYDSVVTDKIVTNTNKYGKVTVHHYIMNTDGSTTTTRVPNAQGQEVPDVVIEGKEGAPYTTEAAKNINEKYELVAEKLPANATGNIEKYNEEKQQEVIYYYRLKPAKVLINYLEKDEDTDDSNNLVLTAQEQIEGHVDDSYNTDTDHRKETIEKDGKTYTLVSDSGNKTGNMTLQDITVTYYYLQNTKATVRYVERDPETGEIIKDLEEPTVKEGLVGDEFVTNSKDFIGYKLVESPENKTITLGKAEETLIYYYEPVYTGLIENHIDDKTGKILETETHEIQVGQDYDIPSKEFEGYDLIESKLPENAEGTMGEELVTVNYYYIKKAVLEVNYIDKLTGEPLADQVVDDTKHEGDNYSTEEKVFENYDMIKVDGNKEGTLAVETDEQGNITNNRTIVTYYYAKKSAGVEEHHIDILTGEDIEEPTLHEGHVGDEYDIKAKEFLSYKLVEADEEGNSMLPTNAIGTMTEEKIVVNYYYNQPTKVIVHYVEKATGKEIEETNPETGELQNSQVLIEGQKDDDYTATAKEFEYYTLIEKPQEEQGKMKVEIVKDEEGNDVVNNTIELYYYYEAKPFNIGVEKEITGIIVNGERREPTNGKLEKVEIYRKSTEETSVQVEYKINVSNTGEVSGNATIEENIPEGMSLANNDGTWEEQEGKLIKVIPELGAGETKEYTVLLNWEQTGENMGEKANEVKLVETGNVPGFVDNNDKDNTSNANVIISVETGELPIGLLVALVALVGLETITLRYAVVLTKRQKKVNKK